MTGKKYKVGKVPYGKGVFATLPIHPGELIGDVLGKVLDDPLYASSYCIDLGHPYSLEPRAPFRYLNHCCEPNAQLFLHDTEYEDGTPALPTVTVEAVKEIAVGEEIRIDYGWSVDGAIPCLCGSQQCRGWVVSAEELPNLLKLHKGKTSKAASKSRTPKASKSR